MLDLRERAVPFVRLNTEDWIEEATARIHLSEAAFDASFTTRNRSIRLSDIKSVYFRRPEPPEIRTGAFDHGVADFIVRESQALLDLVLSCAPAHWVNHPYTIRAAANRVHQLRSALRHSFRVPDTLFTSEAERVEDFLNRYPEGAIVKTIRSPHIVLGGRNCIIYSRHLTAREFSETEQLKYSPLIVQQWIDKKLDIRVTVVGTRVFAAEIHSQNESGGRFDWRAGNLSSQSHSPHLLPQRLEQSCVDLTNDLGLSYAAIDLVLDKSNNYYFLEVNPNGEWAWIQTNVGFPVANAIADLLCSSRDSNASPHAGSPCALR